MINRILYAFSWLALVFIDLHRGFSKSKLRNVSVVFDKGQKGVYKADNIRNLIFLNTHSRCGGILNEWKWNFDASKFVHQRNDGWLIR